MVVGMENIKPTKKKGMRDATIPVTMTPTEGIAGEPPSPKVTAAQRKLNEMVKDLITLCASATVKVAACGCSKKDNCDVFLKTKEIAKIIDKIQDFKIEKESVA